MRNLPIYEAWLNSHLDESITEWIKSALHKGQDAAKSVWTSVKRESRETKEAARLIGELIKGHDVTDAQKEFIKAQSVDLAKAISLVAVSGIPVPIPITPFLILLGKKVGWDILPNSHTKTEYKF